MVQAVNAVLACPALEHFARAIKEDKRIVTYFIAYRQATSKAFCCMIFPVHAYDIDISQASYKT